MADCEECGGSGLQRGWEAYGYTCPVCQGSGLFSALTPEARRRTASGGGGGFQYSEVHLDWSSGPVETRPHFDKRYHAAAAAAEARVLDELRALFDQGWELENIRYDKEDRENFWGALVGHRFRGAFVRLRRVAPDDSAATKVCPDCAEAVLAGARVCRFCRHAFV